METPFEPNAMQEVEERLVHNSRQMIYNSSIINLYVSSLFNLAILAVSLFLRIADHILASPMSECQCCVTTKSLHRVQQIIHVKS